MSSYSVKINDELFLLCSLDFLEHLEGIPALSRLQMDSIADGLRSAVDLAISNLVDRDQVGWLNKNSEYFMPLKDDQLIEAESWEPVYRRKEAEK